jgi:hypothetical protein
MLEEFSSVRFRHPTEVVGDDSENSRRFRFRNSWSTSSRSASRERYAEGVTEFLYRLTLGEAFDGLHEVEVVTTGSASETLPPCSALIGRDVERWRGVVMSRQYAPERSRAPVRGTSVGLEEPTKVVGSNSSEEFAEVVLGMGRASVLAEASK